MAALAGDAICHPHKTGTIAYGGAVLDVPHNTDLTVARPKCLRVPLYPP